jgi:hypothetical protein
MQTLADFKRKLKVGTNVRTQLYHTTAEGCTLRKVWPNRPIGRVQSNCFACITDKDGKSVLSWCNIPKAKDISFPEPHTAKITFPGGYLLYTFLN